MLIGEVSERSGISTRMLRHYDRLGLVSPTQRTPSRYREYSEQDVRRLDQVHASDPTAWSDVLRIIGLMHGLDADDPSARQRFALSLEAGEDNDAIPLAEAALNETDPHVADTLYWALARTGDRALPLLAVALDSPSADRRHRAVAALEKIGSPQASAILAEAFDHPDPLVSRRAVFARGARGSADAIPALVTLVVEGTNDVEAAEVLGTLASRHGCADEIVGTIERELVGATDLVRRRLASALAEIPGPQAQPTLARLTGDPDRKVALTASFVLEARNPDA